MNKYLFDSRELDEYLFVYLYYLSDSLSKSQACRANQANHESNQINIMIFLIRRSEY